MPSHTATEKKRKKKHGSAHRGSNGSSHRRPQVRRSRNQKISDKISLLVKEGRPQKQAVAIANSMARRGEL